MFCKIISFTLFFLSGFVMSQTTYQFEEIIPLQEKEKRNSIVFIHTNWCMYCQQMKHTTFKNKKVIELLNKIFYFLTLDAEEKKDIIFTEKKYSYKPTGMNTGIHELAEALTSPINNGSYPLLLILSPTNEVIYQYNGLLNPLEMINLLEKASYKQ